MRLMQKAFVVCVLLLMVCATMALSAIGAGNQSQKNHSASITYEWFYKWDGTGDKPSNPTPFHIYTVIDGHTTTRTITEITDWDIKTQYYPDGTPYRRMFNLGFGDEWKETFYKGVSTGDNFPYNDFPNEGTAWDKYPDT